MRRHVYLLVKNFSRATYPLRRIDVSTLFSSTDTAAASSTKLSEARLPQPFISCTPPRGTCIYGKLDFFSRFGQGKTKSFIAGADQNGGTFLYDLDQRTVHSQVRLNQPKMFNTISVAAGDALYVLDNEPHPGGRPVLLNTDWDEDLQAHESWFPSKSFLVRLGFGKFCVAKFFQTHHKERTAYEGDVISDIHNFVVLTGLTLLRTGVNGELRMIRHGSQLYYFQSMTNGWVF